MTFRRRPLGVLLFLLGATLAGAQPRDLPRVQVEPDPRARPSFLGPAWTALRAQADNGASFVLRQKTPERPTSLVVFLDGGNGVGRDNARHLRYRDQIALLESPAFAGTLVLLPQCPEDNVWDSLLWDRPEAPYAAAQPSALGEALSALVADLQRRHGIPRERTLIWGLSLGAFGLLDAITWHPEVYGSAVSLAGGGDPGRLASTPQLPFLWLFHGTQDTNVPPEHSRRLARALSEAGRSFRLTLLPGAGHGLMGPLMADQEFVGWLTQWAAWPAATRPSGS